MKVCLYTLFVFIYSLSYKTNNYLQILIKDSSSTTYSQMSLFIVISRHHWIFSAAIFLFKKFKCTYAQHKPLFKMSKMLNNISF